jgi:hypothetical protein
MSLPRLRPVGASGLVVTALYTVVTLVMTWPLVTVVHREVAWDMGDPVFNCWALMWTAGQVLAALRGNVHALFDYWNGNIFYPERLTIAYSEHLTPQMLQSLPIYAATGNIVLCYNLVFLSTFVLSGVAMYLLVRDLTGRPLAAFLAGLAFAFAPYRISQFSHIQELSSFWMPLALLALRRYFVTGRTRSLVAAGAALVLQALSCGYYLLFFWPFAAAYSLYEMASRRLLRSGRVWRSLVLAAVASVVVIVPFAWPYLELRRSGAVAARSFGEAVMFSADTHAFATAPDSSKLWGGIVAAFPKAEGQAFSGFTILAFAGVGLLWGIRRATKTVPRTSGRPWQQALLGLLGVALTLNVLALVLLFINGNFVVTGPYGSLVVRRADRLLLSGVILAGLLVALVPTARHVLRGAPGSAFGFYAGALFMAAVLALGPRILAAGRPIGVGPYYWLWAYVPGFDGVRVPARFVMLVAVFLSVLAGWGAAAVLAAWRRAGVWLVLVGSVAILAESWVVPMSTNVRMAPDGFELTERQLHTGGATSPLYRIIRDAPAGTVLIEFPFGEPAYDILAVFYAGYHRKPLVNGYSGFFPASYEGRAALLGRIPADRAAATRALAESGATHAIVHEGAFPDGRGHEVTDWLVAAGAHRVATSGTDWLLQLR